MILAIFGLLLGLGIGFLLPIGIPMGLSIYLSVGILSALDSIFGGVRATLENTFDNMLFLSGFITNTLLGLFLAFVGNRLGIPLYYSAVFVFGTRLFQNFAKIRRYIINR